MSDYDSSDSENNTKQYDYHNTPSLFDGPLAKRMKQLVSYGGGFFSVIKATDDERAADDNIRVKGATFRDSQHAIERREQERYEQARESIDEKALREKRYYDELAATVKQQEQREMQEKDKDFVMIGVPPSEGDAAATGAGAGAGTDGNNTVTFGVPEADAGDSEKVAAAARRALAGGQTMPTTIGQAAATANDNRDRLPHVQEVPDIPISLKDATTLEKVTYNRRDGAVHVKSASRGKTFYMPLGNYTAKENEQRFIDMAAEQHYPAGPAAALANQLRNVVFEPYELEEVKRMNSE